jgi:hypothetical protein
MAAELKNTGRLNFAKDGALFQVSGSSTIDVTGQNAIKAVKQFSTTDYNFDKGNVVTIGRVFIRNLDATNSVIIGADGTNYPIKVKPLSFGDFEWNAAAVHGKSVAGTPYVEYTLIED